MEKKLKSVDFGSIQAEQCTNSIIIINEGKAYIKQLPQYGIVEIHIRDGKIVKGNDQIGWKLI